MRSRIVFDGLALISYQYNTISTQKAGYGVLLRIIVIYIVFLIFFVIRVLIVYMYNMHICLYKTGIRRNVAEIFPIRRKTLLQTM